MTDTTAASEITRHAETILATLPEGIDGEGPIRQHLTEIIAEAGSMTTETSTAAQWWRVDHDLKGEWDTRRALGSGDNVSALKIGGKWGHTAVVHCPRDQAEQCAVNAWREAGFAHAPQEAPGPKQVEETYWVVIPADESLQVAMHRVPYMSQRGAEIHRDNRDYPDDYRIVKVEATVSEVEA